MMMMTRVSNSKPPLRERRLPVAKQHVLIRKAKRLGDRSHEKPTLLSLCIGAAIAKTFSRRRAAGQGGREGRKGGEGGEGAGGGG